MKMLERLKSALRWYSAIVLGIIFASALLMMFDTSVECTVTTAWDSIFLAITLFPILWYVSWEIVEKAKRPQK